jgi:hypothetical protein
MLDDFAALLANRKIGAATKLAFLRLWTDAGGEPGEILIIPGRLATQLGRDARAARDWIERLDDLGLIDIIEHDEARGVIRAQVYHPCPGRREDTPADPQTRLPFDPAEKDAPPGRAEVSAPKPPPPLLPKKQELLSYQVTKGNKDQSASKTMGTMSVEIAGPAAEPMGPILAEVSAAVLAHADPRQQKARLKSRIRAVVPEVADWTAGAAADLVVYHGVPVEDLDQLLRDVVEMRRAGGLKSPGGFFNYAAAKLARRCGAHWPRGKRQRLNHERANDDE